jgi:hypothetical protein
MSKPLILIFFSLLFSSCSIKTENISTAVYQTISANPHPPVTSTSYPTFTPAATNTPNPTYTSRPTYTSNPTYTPNVIFATTTLTSTPIPPPTLTPTITRTPGIGSLVMCGSIFSIKVLDKPQFETFVYSSKSRLGKFLILRVELTNLSSVSFVSLNSKDFTASSILSGNHVNFNYDSWSSFEMNLHTYGLFKSVVDNPFPPGVAVKAIVIFDVDPSASEWNLVFTPRNNMFADPVCHSEIPLK